MIYIFDFMGTFSLTFWKEYAFYFGSIEPEKISRVYLLDQVLNGEKKGFSVFVFLILAKIASLYCLWKLLIIVFNYSWLSLIFFAYL